MTKFTEAGAIKVLRILGFSGYRSSCSYVDLAVQRFIRAGGTVSDSFRQRLKSAKRAAKRGLGPPKQGDAYPLNNFFRNKDVGDGELPEREGDDWVIDPDAPFGQVRMAIIGTFWMLREIEIARPQDFRHRAPSWRHCGHEVRRPEE